MTKLFKIKNSNRIISGSDIDIASEICDISIDIMLEKKWVIPIENPNIIDLLKNGKKVYAVKIYSERTGCRLVEAKSMIDKIEADINKYRGYR